MAVVAGIILTPLLMETVQQKSVRCVSDSTDHFAICPSNSVPVRDLIKASGIAQGNATLWPFSDPPRCESVRNFLVVAALRKTLDIIFIVVLDFLVVWITLVQIQSTIFIKFSQRYESAWVCHFQVTGDNLLDKLQACRKAWLCCAPPPVWPQLPPSKTAVTNRPKNYLWLITW